MKFFKQSIDKRSSFLEKMLLFFLFAYPLWPPYAAIRINNLPDISFQRFLLVILLVSWGWLILASRSYRLTLFRRISKYRGLFFSLLLYFGWRYFSVIRSDDFLSSLCRVTEEFIYFLLFLVGLTVWRNSRQLWRAIFVIVVSSIIVSSIGLYENHIESNIFEKFIPAHPKYSHTIYRPFAAKIRGEYQIQSTFPGALLLGEYLVFMIPFALVMSFRGIGRFPRILGFIAVIVGALAAWETGSRATIIILISLMALFIALNLLLGVLRRKSPLFLISALLAVIAFFIIIGLKTDLIISKVVEITLQKTHTEALTSKPRILQLEEGIPKVAQNPLLGYGPGKAAVTLGIRGRLIHLDYVLDNHYLKIALESGLPALLFFAFFLVYILRLNVNTILKAKHLELAIAIGFNLSFIGFIAYLSIISWHVAFLMVFPFFSLPIVIKEINDNQSP